MRIDFIALLQQVVVFLVPLLWRSCVGSNSIVSFSVEEALAPYMCGNYLTLKCEARNNNSHIEIRKNQGQTSYNRIQGGRILKYTMKSVTCAAMGIYECVVDQVYTETADVALYDCGPCLCYDDGVRKTTFVDVNETVKFSFCVVVTYNLTRMEFNGSEPKKKESPWGWDLQMVKSSPGGSNRFNITVTRHRMVTEDYGLLKIRVYTSNGKDFFLDFNMTLQPKGDPSKEDKKNPTTHLPLSDPGAGRLYGPVLIGAFLSLTVLILVFISWKLKTMQNKQTRQRQSEHPRARRHRRRQPYDETGREVNVQSDDSRPPHNGTQLNIGEYISKEGLKYVTLAEIQKKVNRPQVNGKKKARPDKTEYAVLDFSLTGKKRVQGGQL